MNKLKIVFRKSAASGGRYCGLAVSGNIPIRVITGCHYHRFRAVQEAIWLKRLMSEAEIEVQDD